MYYFGIDENGNIIKGTYDPSYTSPPDWPDILIVEGTETVWQDQANYKYENGRFILKTPE